MIYDELFDDFADQDLSKLTVANSETKKAIDKIIKDNYDPRNKSVGDRVKVWDSSRLTNAETGRYTTDHIEIGILSNYESVVIEDGCKYEATKETLAGTFTVNLDLKIWNKNLNKVFRTSSEFVKLV
jgi:hypothetical protein